ncbi:MAG: LysR substrate-binding domain-containing protein [Pseudomonadota bacterium]
MQDLNDVFYFSEVVEHGGFAPAGRALRTPKSKLSRRVAALEERLGVRLIERSSRRFRVTDLGRAYYEHCRKALSEVEQADAVIAAAQAEPTGVVRFSCPLGLMELVSPLLPPFLQRFPKVSVQLVAADRAVDLIAERIDVALRVRVKLDTDATMTMRTVAHSRRLLLASPALANQIQSQAISSLAGMPTLSTNDVTPVTWDLEGPEGASYSLTHEPRLACGDFHAVREAAIAGLGVALLPDHACVEALRTGALVRLFPGWHGQTGIVHLVFTTRTGLPPQVRAWIDHLVEGLQRRDMFS